MFTSSKSNDVIDSSDVLQKEKNYASFKVSRPIHVINVNIVYRRYMTDTQQQSKIETRNGSIFYDA